VDAEILGSDCAELVHVNARPFVSIFKALFQATGVGCCAKEVSLKATPGWGLYKKSAR